MKVIIAQCTNQKRDGRHRAKELYMPSDLFKAQRRYAEAYADEWFILSGGYGLIRPELEIQTYDRHISDHDDRWNVQVEEQCEYIADLDCHVEIIAGKEEYGKRLAPWFEMLEIEHSYPFEGLGIGERTKQMKQEARKVENESIAQYA